MVTTDRLLELAHRFVLRDGEAITWSKAFPDGPTVDVETADRAYAVSVAHGLLRVEAAPWVAAVVTATREDLDLASQPPAQVFLLHRDGAVTRLGDAGDVAALGPRLHDGSLDELTYAELLVHGQWPGGWSKRLVVDPEAWRAEFPQPARIPAVAAAELRRAEGTLTLTFTASREYAQAAGGRPVLDVAEWTVTAPAAAPATWQRRLLAEAVALAAPW